MPGTDGSVADDRQEQEEIQNIQTAVIVVNDHEEGEILGNAPLQPVGNEGAQGMNELVEDVLPLGNEDASQILAENAGREDNVINLKEPAADNVTIDREIQSEQGRDPSAQEDRKKNLTVDELFAEAMGPVKNREHVPQTQKKRTKVSLYRKIADGFSSALSGLFRFIFMPVQAPLIAKAHFKSNNLKQKMQQRRRYDLIPGWNGSVFKEPAEGGEEQNEEEVRIDERRVPAIWAKKRQRRLRTAAESF